MVEKLLAKGEVHARAAADFERRIFISDIESNYDQSKISMKPGKIVEIVDSFEEKLMHVNNYPVREESDVIICMV